MNLNSYLCVYIKAHPNWRDELSDYPYFLKIKELGPLAIFNYSLTASMNVENETTGEVNKYRCDFSLPEVQEARGIIINTETLDVVCWPFRKFGNYGEYYVDTIDWDSARIQEKIDGSIIKVWYNDLTKNWNISTNSMIDAREANNDMGFCFYDLFMDAVADVGLDFNILNKDYTYIFELISPKNTIIVRYDKTTIYHIGTRNKITGEELSVDINVKKPREFPLRTLDEVLEAANELNKGLANTPSTDEGFVVVDKDWHRIKVKSPHYVNIHKCANSISHLDALKIALSGDYDEFLVYFPKNKEIIDEYINKLTAFENFLNNIYNEAKKLYADCGENRKEFAEKIKGNPNRGYYFEALKHSSSDDMLTVFSIYKLLDILDTDF